MRERDSAGGLGASRRGVLAGLSALAALGAARGEDEKPPIAHGRLADNPLAQAFERAPPRLPGVTLVGPSGEHDIAEFKGRTVLMPLWAEWCAPCLSELPDFARLQQKFGNDKFVVVPILSGTRRKMTPDTVGQVLSMLHAGIFEPLIEQHLGAKLILAMATKGVHFELPCNLLIAPDGTVMGRQFGMKSAGEAGGPKIINGEPAIVARAEAGDTLSLWGKDAGAEFAAAMADGFLA